MAYESQTVNKLSSGRDTMKKKIIKTISGAMAAAIILSGCNSAQLKFDSEDEEAVEDSGEADSENESDEESTNESEEASTKETEDEETEAKESDADSSADASDVASDADEESDSAKKDNDNDSKKKTDESEFEDITDYDSTIMLDGEELTEDELSDIQDFLNQHENNGFVATSYRTPDKANWNEVFYGGAGIENCDFPDEALDAYLDAIGEDFVEYDLIALSGDDVRSYVESKTGITDFDISLLGGFTYIEEYDILFDQVSDTNHVNIVCEEGIRRDDLIQVLVYGEMQMVGELGAYRRISLIETGDSDNPYMFYSNRELWEDYADSVIEASVYGTDETITCATSGTAYGPDIAIIEDNAVKDIIYPRLSDIDLSDFNDVKEIAFCDINGDDLTDMVLILSDGDDTVAVVCDAHEYYEGYIEYSQGSSAVTIWLSDNVKKLTADNVIEYILNHQDEYNEL